MGGRDASENPVCEMCRSDPYYYKLTSRAFSMLYPAYLLFAFHGNFLTTRPPSYTTSGVCVSAAIFFALAAARLSAVSAFARSISRICILTLLIFFLLHQEVLAFRLNCQKEPRHPPIVCKDAENCTSLFHTCV